ncbi:hypothetical protein BST61_g669 [Cercospora zeina]
MVSTAASQAPDNALGKRRRSESLEPGDSDGDGCKSLVREHTVDENDSSNDSDSEIDASEGDSAVEDGLFIGEDEISDAIDTFSESEADPDAIYNQGQEPYPQLPAFDPAFSDTEIGLTGIVERIVDIVDRNPCKSSYVKNFRAKAEELRTIPRPQPMRIALLGDTGAGKSSLLNSVVDVPDIAKAISSGESCTATAMEYCAAIEGQDQNFAAEITYWDEDAAKILIREHVTFYRQNTEVQTDWDDDIRQLYRRRADTAVKTLHALFCDKEEMRTRDNVDGFLKKSVADSGKAARHLFKWCKELYQRMNLNATRTMRQEASSRRAFREAIDPLLQATSSPSEPNLWPLVMFVRIGIRRSRILQYASITDLPGISDTNAVKVNVANAYIRQCDGLWIVAPISRAVNSTTVDSLYAKYAERFQDSIAIICTRSEDEINPKLAEHYESEGCTTAEYKKAASKCRDIRHRLGNKRRGLQMRQRAAPTQKRKKDIRENEKAIEKLQKQKAKAEQDMLCALVHVRNKFVATGIEQELRSHLPQGKKPKVFCVSNAHYSSCKGVADNATAFQLSAQQTGIPGLREYILELAAPSLFTALEDHLKHHFLVFLKGIQLWVIRKNVQGAEALLDLVKQPQKSLPARFEMYRKECHDIVVGKLLTHSTGKIKEFGTEAGVKWTEKIHRFHWGTLKAFVRNSGCHSTSACPRASWNMDFWGKAPSSLVSGWKQVRDLQSTAITKQINAIVDEMSVMEGALKSEPAVTNLEMDRFYEMLAGHVTGIKNAHRDHQAKLRVQLENIKIDTSRSESPTHFFVAAMQPVYGKLKADGGTGYVKRQERAMFDYVTQRGEASPFQLAFGAIASAVEDQAKELGEKLESQILTILVETWDLFNGMIDPDEQDPDERPLREELRAFLEHSIPRFVAFGNGLRELKHEKKASVKAEEVEEKQGDAE